MHPEEDLARGGAKELRAAGFAAEAIGVGVHWRIEARAGSRTALGHCCWYGPEAALMLGMNQANQRNPSGVPPPAYAGPEYVTALFDDARAIGQGRTRDPSEFFGCVRAWLSGASAAELRTLAPFIDAELRVAESIAARLDPRMRIEITGDPSFEVWAHGRGRRVCRLVDGSCAYFFEQVVVGTGLIDPRAVAAWVLSEASLEDLEALEVTPTAHAALLFESPSRWHWAHFRQRADDPRDVLASLAPLIRALAESPVANRFFTFSSLRSLCFSASSHYPWAGEFPTVFRAEDGAYVVERRPLPTVEAAVAAIEARLAECPIEPFLGTATDLQLPVVAAALVRAGSALTPRLEQQHQWSRVVIGTRPHYCEISDTVIRCFGRGATWSADCRTPDDAIAVALRFLADDVAPAVLASDPRVARYW